MDRVTATAAPAVGTLAALAGLDLVTTARLRVMLAHHEPDEAWAVVTGEHPPHPAVARMLGSELRAVWRRSAAQHSPAEWHDRCLRLGIGAVTSRDPEFPDLLRSDPQPPAVLFTRGCWSPLASRRVGIVGTRNASGVGLEVATRLGHELAEAGVTVVSGLAKGIDGAAHRGALGVEGAGVVGVVANGLDSPYPKQHRDLWRIVAERGLLLSEWPPGTAPEPFRFPLRNRILAALSEIVVVVESRERGGSLTTAREAIDRSIDVMAVPGSVRSRCALGTNQLIRDGAAPVLDSSDVLLALGLDHRRSSSPPFDSRPMPRGIEADVLERCRADPCAIDQIVVEFGLALADAARALARLERSGWLTESGGWYEAAP